MTDFLERVVKWTGGAFLGFGVFFIVVIIAPIVGGVGGWIFAWVFKDSFAALQALLHWQATGFEVGAALGFIGSYLKNTRASTND